MRLFLTAFLVLFISCSDDPSGTNGNGNENGGNGEEEVTYQITEAFPDLSFNNPVGLEHAGDNSDRLFVIEKAGVIQVFDNDSTTDNSSVFLDIQNQVDDRGPEEGLLGLAFHPDYENNGYIYVNYTVSDPARTMISRFEVSDPNSDNVDASTEEEILTFEQPNDNHNGGQLTFGPDGYLYIAVGDGGGAGDPDDNGQDPGTLLGSILRIDVDNSENGNNYGIPSDNPFVNNEESRDEIFAYGLRNPWRFSFDPDNEQLWAADVGQNSYEEINIIEAGNNYGWNIMEGTHCYKPQSGCDESGLTMPVWEYSHDEGQSITGGYVYRGQTLEGLSGSYIYGDYISGKIWALEDAESDDPQNEELVETDFMITSFGTDAENELYICGYNGTIYKLQAVAE